jgi:uncharacterized protein (UPF0261 family)
MATVLLIGTLDTKGPETAYLRDRVRDLGCETLVLDSGILGEAVGIDADFNRRQVAEAAGSTIDALRNAGSRGKAVEEMLKGVRKIALDLYQQGRIHGAASLGGAEGAVLAAAAMKELPIGFPKLIVSPLASGQRKFAPFVGTKDIFVMHSVVDILGLNPISKVIFESAAAAIAGMAKAYESAPIVKHMRVNHDLLVGNGTAEWTCREVRSAEERQQDCTIPVRGRNITTGEQDEIKVSLAELRAATKLPMIRGDRPAIAATMLGNTTRPLMRIRPKVEERGVDFVIFHANGVGGRAMEELIRENHFSAVLDYTLSEVAGQIAGGFHIGGESRLDAAGEVGIPQIVVPGCLDFIVFGAKHEVPEQFQGRPTYYHNPEFTLVRTTREEQLDGTRFVVEKLNRAKGAVTVVVPLGGGSIMDIQGGAFWQPDINEECRALLREGLRKDIRYVEIDAHINDDRFADAVLEELIPILTIREKT